MNRKDDPDTVFSEEEDPYTPALEVSDLRRSLHSIMKPAITVDIDTPIRDAIHLMQSKRIGCVLVTSHRKLLA